MNKKYVGEGKVRLIAGGGRVYTDIAARFVSSERSLDEIIASPYSKELVLKIVNSGHKAALEFDFFLFGIEGYARVTEVQLVRKRLASYMIKTGRTNKGGKRSFDVVIPKGIEDNRIIYKIPIDSLTLSDGTPLRNYLSSEEKEVAYSVGVDEILELLELWYEMGVRQGFQEEELRYLKPQATEFKALIGMNAHALNDWFSIRCCKKAQTEIRDLANKMLHICKNTAPELFVNAGPNCVNLGYCPENELQHQDCKGKIITKNEALRLLKNVKF
ncbi:thymidylate synthase (FAD) [Desulforamulus putei DSM 12395]|uniref:Thymidylate synthase (FAD) n=1 Tax=Desulforamulus putei DSM 12395 TaxID=1121429 RepID=A0A1M4WL62_9FIRM|nr:FAD-dependent thymidylate synthase [Desulforamulus putei]SHE81793.1 thymidylate synthase (FAD) [Desulforamulus putei DSM 12395]